MDLASRAQQAGIELSFRDVQGRIRPAHPDVMEAILASIPVLPLHPWFAEPLVIDPSCSQLELDGACDLPLSWELRTAAGAIHQTGESVVPQVAWSAPLVTGIYALHVRDAAGREDVTPLIVAPGDAWQGGFGRAWVLSLQLYGLRSGSNWGIGDFSDLATVLRIAAAQGAGGVGLNPLHVLFEEYPQDCSPYAPNSRLFLNPLYIDPARAPGLPADFVMRHAAEIGRLRETVLVDYPAVAALKQRALREAFTHFCDAGSVEDRALFERFRVERGRALHRFACFEVLRRRLGSPWWNWPAPWCTPDDGALATLSADGEGEEIAYREYLQWVAERQLAECAQLAVELGMQIGLYLDVAVGVKADGFDAWNEQVAISRHAAVGAPPDPMNTAGQNWGLAGFNAPGLAQTLFAPFRDMLQASMCHAGAIRLDHVLGLQRMFLIPTGFGADSGVYVRMPLAALLAVTTLESRVMRCVVIGEDLGTVPTGFRERLAHSGIWSYRVMLFERDHDGAFRPPWSYAKRALATFSTHDLPTFAAWRDGRDLVVKREIGIDPGETDDERHHAISALAAAVCGDEPRPPAFADVIRFLSAAPSGLLAVALEDLAGVHDQTNIPGTIDQYPNWRRKLPIPLDALAASLDGAGVRDLFGERSRQVTP